MKFNSIQFNIGLNFLP